MSKPIQETVSERVARDPEYRNWMLRESIRAIDSSEFKMAKAMIKDCITEETNDGLHDA
tara:strand:- start:130 stop:306 length:177 start_codon:yes stop_codon:yes gene_type:complete